MLFKSSFININPIFPVSITGKKNDDKISELHKDLEINMIQFHSNEEKIILISIDTLFISPDLKKYILSQIKIKIGDYDEANIIIIASHTHFAPALEKHRINLGQIDNQYFNYLCEKISALIDNFKETNEFEVTLQYADKKTNGITCNRRRPVIDYPKIWRKIIVMEPNCSEIIYEEYKVIKVINKLNDNVVGIIWSLPCHPTNLWTKNLISSEFPGIAREKLRNSLTNEKMPVIYLPGLAGDVRAAPPKFNSLSKCIRTLLKLSYPVSYYRFQTKQQYDNWTDKLVNNLLSTTQNTITQKLDKSIKVSIHKCAISNLGINIENTKELIFRKIILGNSISFYTISAEPVSAYTKIFNKFLNTTTHISTGYVDDVFGYLPTNKQIKDGGYESKGFFNNFLIQNNFKEDVESIIEKELNILNAK